MKKKFGKFVEDARIKRPNMTSPEGATYGAFVLKHPRTMREFVVIVGDGLGWDHVSVSRKTDIPTWDEMCWVKSWFFEDDETVMQLHPAKNDHINIHSKCLHLWRPHEGEIPMPPKEMV